jgi:hypothetical protein
VPAVVSQPGALVEVLDRPLAFSREIRRCFHAPRLGNLPVLRTKWSIAGPTSAGPCSPEGIEPPDHSPDSLMATPDEVETPLRAGLPGRWRTALDESQAVTRCEVAGRCDSLTLCYRSAAPDAMSARLAGAAMWASLVALAVVLVRRGTLWQAFARWPHVFAIALGLAWWLWLWPSIVGLAIVAVVLVSQFVPWLRTPRRDSP